jgi:hypothetical protein
LTYSVEDRVMADIQAEKGEEGIKESREGIEEGRKGEVARRTKRT